MWELEPTWRRSFFLKKKGSTPSDAIISMQSRRAAFDRDLTFELRDAADAAQTVVVAF
jgi:hypothetical protein